MQVKHMASFRGVTADECERMKVRALERNIFVKFMFDKMKEAGCPITQDFVVVRHCEEAATGGFVAPEGVVLCHNQISRQAEVDTALRHELIHAFDYCRGRNLDFSNLQHHSCTEVRAASLSGDCSFLNELNRAEFNFRGQHVACVRRRAALSVSMNPHCPSAQAAREAVDQVWDRCFYDTSPFDRRP